MFWDNVSGVYDLIENMGYKDVIYEVVRGRMPCDIAVINIK